MGHIFISYSHKDSEYAHGLADTLQEHGFDVWIDARIDYGSHWPLEIQKQLDSCDAFILIMSPTSYESEWVQSELQRAKRKQKPIFPLLLRGDETWLSVESTQYYDVRGEKIPDVKFFSDLAHIVSPSEVRAKPLPANEMKVVPLTTAASPAIPIKKAASTSILLLSIAGIGVLLFAAIAVWSMYRRSATPAVADEVLPTPSVPSTQLVAPLVPAATNSPASVPTQITSGSSDLTDSKGVPMKFVPAGEFIAGSNSGYKNERPAHRVYLDDFYIDQYEVTNARYKACVDEGACQPPERTSSQTRESYYGNYEFDNYPVIYVSWEEANSYCQWRGMDLPTEAQWEKAARGAEGRLYPWGDSVDPEHANYNEYVGDTVEVGSYEQGQSPYGVYDMSGNAWEWVADWYQENYYIEAPLDNPAGPATGEYQVLRGGSWHDDTSIVTASNRGWNQLELFYNTDFGFRCASTRLP